VSAGFDNEPLPPAEERLLAHVHALRDHPPKAGDELLESVLRTARWQVVLRPYLAAAGELASAFGSGISASFAGPRSR
jgi:hypothetical protein